MSILDRIDELTALCPCGAPPRPDSPYCSYDCEPTHRAIHTTSDIDGTPMRWRPDLVTAHDDSDLHDAGTMTWYTGRHNARLYQRGIPDRGQPITWHLRLDDGHRYVGLDLVCDDTDVLTDIHEQRMADAWQRLERELGDHRRTEPANGNLGAWDLWQGQRRAARRALEESTRLRICDWLRANNLDPDTIPFRSPIRIHGAHVTVRVSVREDGQLQVRNGELVTLPHTVPLLEPWPAGLPQPGWHEWQFPDPVLLHGDEPFDLNAAIRRIGQAMHQFTAAMASAAERMRYFVDVAYEPQPEPANHPLARVTAQRRNQQHGPQQRQRPPRQLRR